MKGVEILTFGFTIICLMILPTYIGIKLNNVLVGIIIAFVSTISYVLYVAIKRK